MNEAAAREPIKYEYQIFDTPRYAGIDDTWELVDIFPKKRGYHIIYLMVFRREMKEEYGYKHAV